MHSLPLCLDYVKKVLSIRLLPNKFPALHGLRAICIALIVVYHIQPRYFTILINLWFLMDSVFVLSGFLIGLILLNDLSRGKGGLLRFYLRRSMRILPPYYIVLLGAAAIYGIPEPQRKNFWRELVFLTNYNFGNYFMNWSWSLSLDEHFYAVCPLLIMVLHKLKSISKQIIVLCVLWISCLAVRLAILAKYDNYRWGHFLDAIYYPTHCRYDTLVAGMLLAYCFFYFPEKLQRVMQKPRIRFICTAISFSLFSFFALVPVLFKEGSFIQGLIFTFCFGTLSSIAYCALFIHVILVPSRFSRFLSHRVFLYLATLSYGFYLVHLFVQRWLTRPMLKRIGIDYYQTQSFGGWVSECLFVTIVSLLLAYFLHLFVEKPMLAMREKYLR
ncbi:MAG TPA: acyltransferase [Oligoflexia bacterium]|nr:acyltransferase [Oligoflexia bacterium]HMP48491.1 acyltransferase [Oligoflexia bacterium]